MEQNPTNNFAVIEQKQPKPLLNESIKNTIGRLGPKYPFLIFDTHFSDIEKSCLTNLHVNHAAHYNNCGNTEVLHSEVSYFIESLGNDSETSVCASQLVTRIVNEVIVGSGKEAAWVAVRAFMKNDEYNVPRWHTDGRFFFSNFDDVQYKIAIVLKGPHTLFYPLPSGMRDEFESIQQQGSRKLSILLDDMTDKKDSEKEYHEKMREALLETRKVLAEKLDKTKAISSYFGQGAIFIVGSDYSAVYSEPPMHEERLFVSIIPGTKEHIQNLYDRWHPKINNKG